jgi:hypothetical protein
MTVQEQWKNSARTVQEQCSNSAATVQQQSYMHPMWPRTVGCALSGAKAFLFSSTMEGHIVEWCRRRMQTSSTPCGMSLQEVTTQRSEAFVLKAVAMVRVVPVPLMEQ